MDPIRALAILTRDLDITYMTPPDDGGEPGGGGGGGDGGAGGGNEPNGEPNSQPNGEPNGEPNGGDGGEPNGGDDQPDPVAVAAAAHAKVELSRIAQRFGITEEVTSAEDLEAKLDAKARQDRMRQTDTKVQTTYGERRGKVEGTLKGITFTAKNDAGEPVSFSLSPEQQKAVLDEYDGFRADARGELEDEINAEYAQIATRLLPKEVHADFDKAVEGANMDGWLKQVVEFGAASSQYVKNLVLEHEKALATATAEAFVKGNQAPPGQPSQKPGKAATTLNRAAVENMTVEEVAALSEEEFQAAMTRG